MTKPDATITHPGRISRIATLTSLLLLTIAVGTVAAQGGNPVEGFMQGLISWLKGILQLGLFVAGLLYLGAGFAKGAVSYGLKMFFAALGAIGLIEFSERLVTMFKNGFGAGGTDSTNSTEASFQSAQTGFTSTVNPSELVGQAIEIGHDSFLHLTIIAEVFWTL